MRTSYTRILDDTQQDLAKIVTMFAEVFKRKVKILDGDGYDKVISIDPEGFEIWPAAEKRYRPGRIVEVRTWELFENVVIPSFDRDTPDDCDSLPRGTFGSISDVVAAAELAIARQDIEGRIQAWGERMMVLEAEGAPVT